MSSPSREECLRGDRLRARLRPEIGPDVDGSADKLIAFLSDHGLRVEWILETHAHADHLTAAPTCKEKVGGKIAIGAHIKTVQATFKHGLQSRARIATDGTQFDHLFKDDERFTIGALEGRVIHTPGHTPACLTYVIGDAAFVGDTLFMPDYGTARCDFPGGDARHPLPIDPAAASRFRTTTRLFMCHDYKAPGRDVYAWETTVAAERKSNIHVHDGVSEAEFVRMRTARDATLAMPTLILPRCRSTSARAAAAAGRQRRLLSQDTAERAVMPPAGTLPGGPIHGRVAETSCPAGRLNPWTV